MSKIVIRPLTVEDINLVIEIDAKISNPLKPVFDIDLEATAKWVIPLGYSLGAEIDGKFVGFVLGHTRSSEFGVKGKIGWLNVIGVDPDFQGRRIGTLLGDGIIKQFKEKNVSKIQTMLNWNQGDLITYLSTLGFQKSPMIVVEKLI
ncbi:MAG: Acetyltransferase YpeA [Candidatus Heimdallarchaeota archaeon LC_3]|nr:MAG: Acetyltransferase YpeA [Candidatus Heimdallarchaeota archaeon LC_3]